MVTTNTTPVDSQQATASLIGSDKVQGTTVYGADDQKIGSVQRIMIHKMSGKVTYAVISFGGFLGMGEDYFPMPWASHKYDTRLYRVGVTDNQLKGAPKFNRNTDWDWSVVHATAPWTTITKRLCSIETGLWQPSAGSHQTAARILN